MGRSGSSSGSGSGSGSNGRVPVGVVPSYYEDDMLRYDSPLTAIVREVIQNSVDAVDRVNNMGKAPDDYDPFLKIELRTADRDFFYGRDKVGRRGDVIMKFTDNGTGITREIMESILVSVGGSDKQGRDAVIVGESERGGFGAAKNLIFFAQEYYEVTSAHIDEPGEWYIMKGAKGVHDRSVARDGDGADIPFGTQMMMIMNNVLLRKPKSRDGEIEDLFPRRGSVQPQHLAKMWITEIKRSYVPNMKFSVTYETEKGRTRTEDVTAAQPREEEHARHGDGDWILYKNHKRRGEHAKSRLTVQVLGVHMFTETLDALRSDYDIVMDIQKNSKEHLNQHRDSLKNDTEHEVLRTFKTLDKSRGTFIRFAAQSGKEAALRKWGVKVKQLLAAKEEGDDQRAKKLLKEVKERAKSFSSSNEDVKKVMTALADDNIVLLEATLANLDISYNVLSTYGRRRLPPEWLDAENLVPSMRVFLRTIRVVLDTIFATAKGKYLIEHYNVGVVFTPSDAEREAIGEDPKEAPKGDHAAEIRMGDGPPTIFVNPQFDATGKRTDDIVALKMDEKHASKNIYYLWGLMCHEAAHLSDEADAVYEHGADFCAERDRLQWLTTGEVGNMIRKHKQIIKEEDKRDRPDKSDSDHLYYYKCARCGKIRRVPTRSVHAIVTTKWECKDNYWDRTLAKCTADEEKGLRARVGSSSSSSSKSGSGSKSKSGSGSKSSSSTAPSAATSTSGGRSKRGSKSKRGRKGRRRGSTSSSSS